MGSVEYRILEYASSEEVARGVDFLVVLRFSDAAGPSLRAYLWEGWADVVTDTDERTVEYLESVIYDVRQQLASGRSQMNNAFFDLIGDLNIGPLRTSASGSCEFENADSLSSPFFDLSGELIFLSADGIKSLIESITNCQLQAARS